MSKSKKQNEVESKIEDLKHLNKNDMGALAVKMIGGAIPFFGSAIAEIIVHSIPNQRQDRIIRYLRQLDEKLDKLPKELTEGLNDNQNFITLLEETIDQAAKATTEQRRDYLSSIVINGISDDKIKLDESEFILSLFKQLTDVQVIWLKYYSLYMTHFQREYYNKHKNILQQRLVYLGASDDEVKHAALQKSNTENLVRLNLVEEEYDLDKKTKQLVMDTSKKKPKIKSYRITTIGKAVLSHIGIYEDPRELLK